MPPINSHVEIPSYEWEKQTIKVASRSRGIVNVEDADCYGPLAIHPIIGDDDRIDNLVLNNEYAITSVNCGRMICAVVDPGDAIKVVERMIRDRIVHACLRKKDRETIVKNLEEKAPWFLPWTTLIRMKGCYCIPDKTLR